MGGQEIVGGWVDEAQRMPLPVWDVCQECGARTGERCQDGRAFLLDYLHESRRTVPTSEASRIARAHEAWLPADD